MCSFGEVLLVELLLAEPEVETVESAGYVPDLLQLDIALRHTVQHLVKKGCGKA